MSSPKKNKKQQRLVREEQDKKEIEVSPGIFQQPNSGSGMSTFRIDPKRLPSKNARPTGVLAIRKAREQLNDKAGLDNRRFRCATAGCHRV